MNRMQTHHNVSDRVSRVVERRIHARVPTTSVAYIELGQQNGGLILNVSEGGIAVQAAEIVAVATFEKMRFQLPKSDQWIEVGGKLVWEGHSRKKVGVQFVNLSDEARQQIQNWADSAALCSSQSVSGLAPNSETEREAHEGPATLEDSYDLGSEFDSAFPSEKNPGRVGIRAGHAGKPRVIPPADNPEPALNQYLSETGRQHRGWHERRTMTGAEGARQHAGSPPTQADRMSAGASAPKQTPRPTSRMKSGATSIEGLEFYGNQVASHPAAVDYHDADLSRKMPPDIFRNPMSQRDLGPHPFSGLEYPAVGFEQRPRKAWLAVAGIALAIFVAGGVLAIGPSNVKTLFLRQPSALVEAPPPPANAFENTPAESRPPAGNNELPPTPSPGQSSLSLGIPTENGVSASDQDAKATGRKSSPPAAERVPLQNANAKVDSTSSDDAESREAITRRFQLEHQEVPATATNGPVAEMNSGPASQDTGFSVKQGVPPGSDQARTLQSSPVSSTIPKGLVAISSHFQSVQGTDPDQIGEGSRLTIGQLVSIKQPVYPAEAVREHVEGTVHLRVVVDQIGHVEVVYVVSGPPMLVPAAIDAVREWRYRGTVLGSKAVKSVEDIAVVFQLGNSLESPR
jgi:outer membrane biosynthesis protein TonB